MSWPQQSCFFQRQQQHQQQHNMHMFPHQQQLSGPAPCPLQYNPGPTIPSWAATTGVRQHQDMCQRSQQIPFSFGNPRPVGSLAAPSWQQPQRPVQQQHDQHPATNLQAWQQQQQQQQYDHQQQQQGQHQQQVQSHSLITYDLTAGRQLAIGRLAPEADQGVMAPKANLLQQDAHRPAAPANTSAGTEAGTKRGHGQILGTYLHTPWCQCMGDGRVYYWNTATGVSNYLMPAELHGMALIPYNITQVPPAKKHAAGRSGLNDQLGAFQGGDNRAVAVEQPTGAATAASGGGLSVAAAPADAATDRNSAGIAAPATVAEPGPVFIGDTDRQVAYPSSARQLEAAGRPAPQPAAVGGGAAPPEPQGQNMTDQLPPPGNQTVEGAPATAEVGIGPDSPSHTPHTSIAGDAATIHGRAVQADPASDDCLTQVARRLCEMAGLKPGAVTADNMIQAGIRTGPATWTSHFQMFWDKFPDPYNPTCTNWSAGAKKIFHHVPGWQEALGIAQPPGAADKMVIDLTDSPKANAAGDVAAPVAAEDAAEVPPVSSVESDSAPAGPLDRSCQGRATNHAEAQGSRHAAAGESAAAAAARDCTAETSPHKQADSSAAAAAAAEVWPGPAVAPVVGSTSAADVAAAGDEGHQEAAGGDDPHVGPTTSTVTHGTGLVPAPAAVAPAAKTKLRTGSCGSSDGSGAMATTNAGTGLTPGKAQETVMQAVDDMKQELQHVCQLIISIRAAEPVAPDLVAAALSRQDLKDFGYRAVRALQQLIAQCRAMQELQQRFHTAGQVPLMVQPPGVSSTDSIEQLCSDMQKTTADAADLLQQNRHQVQTLQDLAAELDTRRQGVMAAAPGTESAALAAATSADLLPASLPAAATSVGMPTATPGTRPGAAGTGAVALDPAALMAAASEVPQQSMQQHQQQQMLFNPSVHVPGRIPMLPQSVSPAWSAATAAAAAAAAGGASGPPKTPTKSQPAQVLQPVSAASCSAAYHPVPLNVLAQLGRSSTLQASFNKHPAAASGLLPAAQQQQPTAGAGVLGSLPLTTAPLGATIFVPVDVQLVQPPAVLQQVSIWQVEGVSNLAPQVTAAAERLCMDSYCGQYVQPGHFVMNVVNSLQALPPDDAVRVLESLRKCKLHEVRNMSGYIIGACGRVQKQLLAAQ